MKKILQVIFLSLIIIANSEIAKAKNFLFPSEKKVLQSIYACWSFPLGLPNDEKIVVKIKLKLDPYGKIYNLEILERPKKEIYNKYVDSIVRAIQLCQPYNLPISSYERWKELTLILDGTKKIDTEKSESEKTEAERLESERIEAARLKREKEESERLEREKKEAERLAKIKENKIKKFYLTKLKKAAEAQQNLNFIAKIFENKNLIELNCFEIDTNTHFRIFIDDKLKKAVEIYPSGRVKILHSVKFNNDYFNLDLHSVKIPSGFYSKEEIIINNFLSQRRRNVSLAPTLNDYIEKYADERIRFWIINRYTGVSQIEPFGTVINDKVIVMDDTNQPTDNYFNLEFAGGKKYNCSKKSF